MKKVLVGKVTMAQEFIEGGYQGQCSGFSICVKIEDKIGGNFINGSEAFNSNPENLKIVRNELKNILNSYNIKCISDLIGMNILYQDKNGKCNILY